MEPHGASSHQREGYLVVLSGPTWAAEPDPHVYRYSPRTADGRAYQAELRARWPGQRQAYYRGVDRKPIGGSGYGPDGRLSEEVRRNLSGIWQGERYDLNLDARTLPDWRASQLWQQIMGEDRALWFEDADPCLLPSIEIAKSILTATDAPERHEVIRVERYQTTLADGTLGWDLAAWGGGSHWSAICEFIVLPRTILPGVVSAELLGFAEALNRHGLFDTATGAQHFFQWLRAQPCDAETAEEQASFEIIRVDEA